MFLLPQLEVKTFLKVFCIKICCIERFFFPNTQFTHPDETLLSFRKYKLCNSGDAKYCVILTVKLYDCF